MANSALPAPVKPVPRLASAPACLRCDYDFTGLAGDTCPECGARHSEAHLDVIRSLPEWRERYLARSRLPAIAAHALALGLAPFAGFAEDELEARPSPARRAALRALSWIVPIAGGVLAVRYLFTAAMWRL